jgi:hypothetical protein
MRQASAIAVLFLSILACGGRRASETPPAPAAASTSIADAAAAIDSSTPVTLDAGTTTETTPDAALTPTKTATTAKPAPVERTGKTWPFHAWDRAEAFTFNRFPMGPGAPFRIYDDNGWSKHVADKKPLDAALSKQAVDLVLAGKSELEMTKCPFPRHAVVLYDHDVPVASINVCFECGDILLWPRWTPPESAKLEKLFAQVFPKWKTFFRDAVGFPIDEKWR